MANIEKVNHTPAHIAVQSTLGAWPEDIVCSLETAANALSWIDTMLRVASKQKEQGPHSDAGRLVEAAQYIAMDFSNLADCQRESMRDHLTKVDTTLQEMRA